MPKVGPEYMKTKLLPNQSYRVSSLFCGPLYGASLAYLKCIGIYTYLISRRISLNPTWQDTENRSGKHDTQLRAISFSVRARLSSFAINRLPDRDTASDLLTRVINKHAKHLLG